MERNRVVNGLTLRTCCFEPTIFEVFWSLAVVLATSAVERIRFSLPPFLSPFSVGELTFGGVFKFLVAVEGEAV